MSQRRSNRSLSASPSQLHEGSQAARQLLAEINEILFAAEAQGIRFCTPDFDAFLDRLQRSAVR